MQTQHRLPSRRRPTAQSRGPCRLLGLSRSKCLPDLDPEVNNLNNSTVSAKSMEQFKRPALDSSAKLEREKNCLYPFFNVWPFVTYCTVSVSVSNQDLDHHTNKTTNKNTAEQKMHTLKCGKTTDIDWINLLVQQKKSRIEENDTYKTAIERVYRHYWHIFNTRLWWRQTVDVCLEVFFFFKGTSPRTFG